MDRVSVLADELTSVLDRLHEEASERNMRSLVAPLAWLDEANSWLRYELRRSRDNLQEETVSFRYIPLSLRK